MRLINEIIEDADQFWDFWMQQNSSEEINLHKFWSLYFDLEQQYQYQ